MTIKEHKKHTKLARPAIGNFGRNEWAFVGAPCSDIKQLTAEVIAALSPQYKCAYADASHHNEASYTDGGLAEGSILDYTDHGGSHQFNLNVELSPIALKQQFSSADIVLVNGNHHTAKAQVVVIDKRKAVSLQKRITQLSSIALFLLAGEDDIFDFVKEAVADWQRIPVYRVDETNKIIDFFRRKLEQAKPVLNGLVLAGGKSMRMGLDKGAIKWYGKEQRYHLADMLKQYCKDVFISCRDEEQQKEIAGYQTLPDTFTGLGPYGAILSAFRDQPDSAWLVVACDMPLLRAETLNHLVSNRNTSAIATTYKSAFDGFPEPLITIWEPRSYAVLLAFLAQGYSCPRKVLINSDTTVLMPPDATALTNVNTPEELEIVKRQLNQHIASA